jgi:hyperosmotically inducible periplasmic protein
MNWSVLKRPSLLLSCVAALLLAGPAMADGDKKAKSYSDKAKAESSERKSGDYAKRAKESAADATLTAAVKSRLMMSEHTAGLDIQVESDGDIVTLKGEVESEEVREHAELIAMNTHGVDAVDNRLEVSGGDRY